MQALEKARRLTQAQATALSAALPLPHGRTHLSSVLHGNLRLIPVDEILYLRADQKYVTVRHCGGEALIEDSLKSLEDEFGERFIRVHRNALVARSAIEGIEKGGDGTARMRLRGCEERLEISRRHLPEVRRRLREGRI